MLDPEARIIRVGRKVDKRVIGHPAHSQGGRGNGRKHAGGDLLGHLRASLNPLLDL